MNDDLSLLIAKLNPACKKALEAAAQLCVSNTNYNVELEHFVFTLLDIPNSDIQMLLRYFGLKNGEIQKYITIFIEKFRRGNARPPALSSHILRLMEQSWQISSLYFNSEQIRSGIILLTLLSHTPLRDLIIESIPSFKKISVDILKKEINNLIKDSSENTKSDKQVISDTQEEIQESKTLNLDQYTIDLTLRARQNLIDPILERDTEIRQVIDILTRRRQNNPILTGEAGVGKTAVAEGFALRVAKGDVPHPLKKISLRLLDMGLLQAGAGIKGEFEKRLKSIIDEVHKSVDPIILFIDEAHTMIGAGGTAGMGDAANLLKPALARGELRTIAATTWSEYKKYFEKDPALARRFQVVKVDEPDEEAAVRMLRGIVANLEKHHNVSVLEEAVQDAVRLSNRYITGRQLPDKAIGVLDTACARVSVGQSATPPEVEDMMQVNEQLEVELNILKREQNTGYDHSQRIETIENELKNSKTILESLKKRWKKELDLVKNIIKLQNQIISEKPETKQPDNDLQPSQNQKLITLKTELKLLQNDKPMVPTCVDSGLIAHVISDWTGIPVGKMLTDEIGTVLDLKTKMQERIIGQAHALDAICRRIKTYRANLDDPGKPVGVFLLAGPSGIGKTETAIALADILYGGSRNMITINMSEYQEAHTVSGLKGSPPGYVGYGKGGVLTEAVRQRPYSVVLLDEVEKAHPDVMELFYQVFDKGMIEDSEGLTVDFKNTLILLTSNAGSRQIMQLFNKNQEMPACEAVIEKIRPALLQYFKPALLGRLAVVPYYPLSHEVIRDIVQLKIKKIQDRFQENHHIKLSYDENVLKEITERCKDSDTGARNVDNILTHSLLPELSGELLQKMAIGEVCSQIYIYLDSSKNFAYKFDTACCHESVKQIEPASLQNNPPLLSPKHIMDRFQEEYVKNALDSDENKFDDDQKDNQDENKKKSGWWRNIFKQLELFILCAANFFIV